MCEPWLNNMASSVTYIGQSVIWTVHAWFYSKLIVYHVIHDWELSVWSAMSGKTHAHIEDN